MWGRKRTVAQKEEGKGEMGDNEENPAVLGYLGSP